MTSYIPDDAEWYLADIVMKITVEGDPRSVFHYNLTLVRADSPDHAYARALEIGRESEISYLNTEEKNVMMEFFGLRNLFVIQEPLEDGAELLYEESIGISDEEAGKQIREKDQLAAFQPAVFQPMDKRITPNYGSKDIFDEIDRILKQESEPGN